jgi:hypothetical protein
MQFRAVPILTAAFICASAANGLGQSIPGSVPARSRFSAGANGVLSQPKGEFASNVGNGYGFDLNGMFHLDYRGYLSLRLDVGGVQYGRERNDASIFGGGGRIPLDLTTTNSIAWGAIGPQLMIPDGPIRPYVNAAIAYTNFSTTSTLSDPNGQFDSISNENQGDGSRAWIFGGGVQFPIGTSAAINAGARYYYGGRATYLTRGDIVDNPDGTITIFPRNSKTDLVLWQLGFSMRFSGSTGH